MFDRYNNIIRETIKKNPPNGLFEWILRHPLTGVNRKHIQEIVHDVSHCSKTVRILDEGAGDGIFSRLMLDKGFFNVITIDSYKPCEILWNSLGISGKVADCFDTDKWWDGNRFDVVVAMAWTTSTGTKGKTLTSHKEKRLELLYDHWGKLLQHGGVVYFDVRTNRFDVKYVINFFSKGFKVSKFKTKSKRIILKCRKF